MVGTKIDGGGVKSIGNGESKEHVCTTHGHELRGEECRKVGWFRVEGDRGEKKNGTTVIA